MPPKIVIDFTPHRSQMAVHNHPARFKVLAAGRRWGKTLLGVHECLDVASKGGRAWWVAPSYKMGEVGWRPLRKMGVAIGAEVRRVDRQIILPNGGEVQVRSADNPDNLRGEGLDFAVLDECAFMPESVLNEAIRPALSDRNGTAIFISTPKGRNWFWRIYQRGIVKQNEWAAWRLPTSDNPHIDKSEIESARQTLPDSIFKQEYLAEFLENEGAVFRNLAACHNATTAEPLEHAGHRVVVGVDWAKQADFTAISIGCADCHRELAVDRFNQIDYHFQVQRLQGLVDRYRVRGGLAETNSMGEPLLEQVQRLGLPVIGFQTTASSKPPLIENLALTYEKAEWQFIDDPIWRAEAEAYERKVSPVTGRSQYSAPEGLHDDTVIARALMVWQARNAIPLPAPQTTQSKWANENANGTRWRRF